MNKDELKDLVNDNIGVLKEIRVDVVNLIQALEQVQNGGDVTFTHIDLSRDLLEDLAILKTSVSAIKSGMKARAMARMKEA